ncbi:hypothetical protein ACN5ZK_09580 [Macrococcoides bohemicum]|uniref:hypothetical protein n=1 Tax=Macrococcoides bohemicum TaxID=1903056 RepID=UPI0010595B19|nr:hypothetical protein [Macrococcus bohemicus]QYA45469.1 hypothetical protein KYI13_03875 [Macrococcus bohemicus]TDL40740.1 hypothetical protein EVU91_02275 [Macrococcus bohemicus]
MEFIIHNLSKINDNNSLPIYSCTKYPRIATYFNEEAWGDSRPQSLVSNTHYLMLDDEIVGYFTLSLNIYNVHYNKRQEFNLENIYRVQGIHENITDKLYQVLYLNFFGIDDKYKSRTLDNTNIKYSDLLMFFFFDKAVSLLEIVPYAMIVLKAVKGVEWLYEKYDFKKLETKGETIYGLPAAVIENYLDVDNSESPFQELFNYMYDQEIEEN